MKKWLTKGTASLITALMLSGACAICGHAAAPVENGSNAKAELAEKNMIAPNVSEESNAFPGWLVLSSAGAVVIVGGIVAGAVISGRNSDDKQTDDE